MRRSTPDAKRANITNALKDLDIVDLDQRIRLDEKNTQLFTTQLEKDSKFLADCGIIDYSLLLGVHHIDRCRRDSLSRSGAMCRSGRRTTAAC